jgi:hypothetical protein
MREAKVKAIDSSRGQVTIQAGELLGARCALVLSGCRIDGARNGLALLQRSDPAARPMVNGWQYAGADSAVDSASYHVQSVCKLAILFLKLCVIGRNILAHRYPYRTPW